MADAVGQCRNLWVAHESAGLLGASRNVRAIVFVALVLILAGCGNRPPNELVRRKLDPVRTHRGLVGRSALECPAGDCILLHYPRRLASQAQQAMYDQLETTRTGELFVDDESRWTTHDGGVPLDTFNCCTFAVGDWLGLSTADWVAPNRTSDTEGTVPMQVVLDSYFKLVREYDHSDLDWQLIEQDAGLENDDVFCFVSTRQGVVEFTHVGRISKVGAQNWLISKLGNGPIVRAPIQATGADFRGQFDGVQVYRWRA